MNDPQIPLTAQVRLTTWPRGSAVTVPDVPVSDVLAVDGPPALLVYGNTIRTEPVAEELVFGDFMEFDCDDLEAIAEFEHAHGRLGTSIESSFDYDGDHFPPFVGDQPAIWRG